MMHVGAAVWAVGLLGPDNDGSIAIHTPKQLKLNSK